ncbi:Chaperone [Oryctes borbonicus]|uniref:Chaperone n=1 Tax=Oryctes borbonicus TaxID=1629725 RepID=A0A0T6ASN3_9SCAR|nr:Chaperone [Oryctes borbonicus]
MSFLNLVILLCFINYCLCWDSDQLEVFDVVEEVKVNFYEALNVSQDDSSAVIRSAFRRQSLLLHPDKNPDVDTSEQFRNLVAIYEVLKDPIKRKYYDEVLVNGLPNWRSAVYYYRHVRKMGLLEMTIILFCIITIGQYIVSWAAFLERKYTLEQIRGRKQKKIVATIELEKPSFKNTLPFQIPMFIYKAITSMPMVLYYFKEKTLEKIEAAAQKEEVEEEVITEPKPVRRRKPAFVLPEGPTFEATPVIPVIESEQQNSVPLSGGLWTDDDLEQLIVLVKKIPGGTPGRWDLIAEALRRTVPEVTYMANKMKSNGYKLPSQVEEVIEQPRVKQKTKGGKLGGELPQSSVWTQSQQKALEDALLKYPKGSLERWERIAECVLNKTKEECMLRYKSLVEAVKNKKENTQDMS